MYFKVKSESENMIDSQQIDKERKISEYLLFLNSLGKDIQILDIIGIQDHSENCLIGWNGVKTITGINAEGKIYEIDIRFAWDNQIFKQDLYDHGWNTSTLLHKNDNKHQSRIKLIVYLCHPSIGLVDAVQRKEVPNQFIIGRYWENIHHFYLKMSHDHPFELSKVLDSDITNDLYSDNSLFSSNLEKNEISILEGGLRTKGIHKSGTSNRPLTSVITIVFNGEEKLAQTIQSVINQNHDNFEYIIIDGGSTDKTLEIIREYESLIDYWISEKDSGIYDAMNKGIDLANGQWLSFMNCADLFYSYQSLNSVPLAGEIDFYYSDSILYNYDKAVRLHKCSQDKKIFIHQSIIYKRDIHAKYKYLVHDNLTISDYFLFRKNDSKKWCKLEEPLSIYNTDGISSTSSTQFTQQLFVDFITGDISALKMSFLIIKQYIKELIKLAISWRK
jgi:Glycosyl transferase family 2